jgi:hypothetical protein
MVGASFDAEEFRNQQTTPLRLRFAAARRLLLAFLIEAVKSQVDPTGRRMTGVGDVEPGLQVVTFIETGRRPAVAFAYFSKLPSASAGVLAAMRHGAYVFLTSAILPQGHDQLAARPRLAAKGSQIYR